MIALLPAPKDRPATKAITLKDDSTELVEMEDKGALAALAFKVQLWDGRRHVFARIYRGTLSAGDKVRVAGSGKEERVARIFDVNAGNKKRIDTAVAGQIVLLAGLKHATTGDTLCRAEHEVLLSASESRPVWVSRSSRALSKRSCSRSSPGLRGRAHLKFVEDEETGSSSSPAWASFTS